MTREEHWLLTEKYHGVTSADFYADLDRLAAGEPLAYLIGHLPFLQTTISLGSHPLIPRTETEYWVNACHEIMKESKQPSLRVLDLCAGSGAIGVATLAIVPTTLVDFIEIDSTHLSTIQKNLTDNSIDPSRYRVFCDDLFEPLATSDLYDFILCNPPYIDRELNRTEASVLDHEPALALFSEEHGLAHIQRIIEHASTHLIRTGELWLEHEPEHTHAIHLLSQTQYRASTHRDQYGVERFSRLVLQ